MFVSVPKFALAGLLLGRLAVGFQEIGGPACSGSGSCTYSYVNGNGDTVNVNAFCAPNGFCGDNGAPCTTGDNCYNNCATQGANLVCGGLGAACNTQSPFQHNQFDQACFTPGFVCTTDGTPGNCVLGASQGARLREKRAQIKARQADEKEFRERVRRAAAVVASPGDEDLE